MNDRLSPRLPIHAGLVDPALPAGSRLGPFEIQWVISRSASAVVYQALDHSLAMPVAIQEYLPARLVRRDADHALWPVDEWQADVVARGLRTFIGEARMLARCDHAALVRILQLHEANGTAYRMMPLYVGERLVDVRCGMPAAPDEAALRALADQMLGAIGAIHALGSMHGNVSASNILLRADDRPLLLSPGAATAEVGSDLVESLMATLGSAAGSQNRDGETRSVPNGMALDLVGLADVLRFCITGRAATAPAADADPSPLSTTIATIYAPDVRPAYSEALLDTIDAALSPFSQDRPIDVAQFRRWLQDGPPRARQRIAAAKANALPIMPPVAARPTDADEVTQPAVAAMPASASTPWAAAVASNFSAMSAASAASRTVRGPSPAADLPDSAAPAAAIVGGAAGLPVLEDVAPASSISAPKEPFFEQSTTAPFDDASMLAFEREFDPEPELAGRAAGSPGKAWVPPKLPADRKLTPGRGLILKTALVGLLIVAGAAIVAVATGAFQGMPELRLDHRIDTTVPAAAMPAGAEAAAPVVDPGGAAAPMAAPASAAAAGGAPPAPQAVAAPGPATHAVVASNAEPPTAPDTDPAEVLRVQPPAAGSTRKTSHTSSELAKAPGNRRAGAPSAGNHALAAAAPATPRAACSGRTDFALYRCMQIQCGSARWSSHAQCVRLRTHDELD
jgi:serine/threonine protein kinase